MKQPHEERLVETVGTIILLQLIEQGMPHLPVHTPEAGPGQHIFGTMKGCPGTLALKTDVMHTLHHKLAHAVVEHLCLDLAVHHLAHELLHLLTCCDGYLQVEEMNEIVFQRVFLRIPGHDLRWQFGHDHPTCLTEVVQHLEVILGLGKVLVILVVHILLFRHQVFGKDSGCTLHFGSAWARLIVFGCTGRGDIARLGFLMAFQS